MAVHVTGEKPNHDHVRALEALVLTSQQLCDDFPIIEEWILALRAFEEKTLGPLTERLRAAMERAATAEKADRRIRGDAGVPGAMSRLHRATWRQKPGMLGLLQALQAHAENDLVHVQAPERKAPGGGTVVTAATVNRLPGRDPCA